MKGDVLVPECWFRPGITPAYLASPDGARVFTGSLDGSVGVWKRATGLPERVIRAGAGVVALACSPDGARLWLGLEDGGVELRDPATGNLIAAARTGAADARALALHPDGTLWAAGSSLAALDADTLAPIRVVHDGGSPGTAVTLSANGDLAAYGDERGDVVVLKTTGHVVARFHEDRADTVQALHFSADASKLWLGGHAKFVVERDASTGEPLRILEGCDGAESLGLSGDGRTLYASGADGTWAWDLASDGLARVVASNGGRGLAFEPRLHERDSFDNRLFDAPVPRASWRGPRGYPARAFAPTRDGASVYLLNMPTAYDALLYKVDCATGRKELWWKDHDHLFRHESLAIGADGRFLSSRLYRAQFLRFDLADPGRDPLPRHALPGVGAGAFSPDGARLYASPYYGYAQANHDITAIDWDSGRELFRLSGHDAPVTAIAVGPSDGVVYSGDDDGVILSHDGATGERLSRVVHPAGSIDALVPLAVPGRFLSLGEGLLLSWHGERAEVIASEVRRFCASADGSVVAFVRDGGLWLRRGGAEQPIRAEAPEALACSADGRLLFLGFADCRLVIERVDDGKNFTVYNTSGCDILAAPDGSGGTVYACDRPDLLSPDAVVEEAAVRRAIDAVSTDGAR